MVRAVPIPLLVSGCILSGVELRWSHVRFDPIIWEFVGKGKVPLGVFVRLRRGVGVFAVGVGRTSLGIKCTKLTGGVSWCQLKSRE